MKLSAKCLANSLSVIGISPKNITITDKDKDIIAEIKNETKFKEKIKSILRKYAKGDNIVFNIAFEWMDFDV